MRECLKAALAYANHFGWAVFPVGRDKRPLTPNGCKAATTDADVINAWWKRWPAASVGIATGSISQLIVIDEDVDEDKGLDGIQVVEEWQRENGELPETARAITGRGGNHLYYHYTGSDIKNRVGLLEGVDVRGEGGYIIAPPSIHPNGRQYEWELPPEEIPVAEVNDTIRALLNAGQETEKHKRFVLPERIRESNRNNTLHRLACSLQAQGLPDAAIAQAVAETNESICDPPLDAREISSIVNSALRYEKGTLKTEAPAAVEAAPWAEGLELVRTKTGEVKNCFSNYVALLGAAPLLDGNVWRDALSGRIMLQSVPWEVDAHELSDTDIYHLRWRLDKQFGLSNENNLRQAVTILADQHRRHPIVEWLESLPPWDGVSRLGRLFPRYLGAEDSEYVTAVTKLLFFGMRQRVYHPGIKFDLCITLADTRQGTGKSSMCRLLAGRDEWARDAIGDLHDSKATFEAMSGAWVVELGELIATRRTKDVETIKAFLSRVEDIYRTPYSTYPRHYPRQGVFIGTTNRPQFLPEDPTGNRRFIPIICDGSKAERHPLEDEVETRSYIAKCFAEALVLGEAEGWPLTLDEKFDAQLAAYQEVATPEDTRIGRIQSYLDASDLDKVCTQIIWADVFAGDGIAPSRKELQEIADIMSLKINGWRRYQGGGERHTYWFGKKIGAQRAWERIGSPLCSPLGSGLGFTDASDDIDYIFSQEL